MLTSGPAASGSCVDTCLEEIWHGLTDYGYGEAFPSVFGKGFESNSLMTQAMDVARGGRFEGIPSQVPADAWYSFTEPSCSYECQGTEYIYWAVNAWVGALVNRGDSIQAEWQLETREKLEATDLKITAVIKDTSTYRLPSVSPTGHYTGPATCSAK